MRYQIFSLPEMKKELRRLPIAFEDGLEEAIVVRNDRPVMAILPFEKYKELLETIESLEETLEILRDEELMGAFRRGVKAMQQGELIDWKDAERELEHHEVAD